MHRRFALVVVSALLWASACSGSGGSEISKDHNPGDVVDAVEELQAEVSPEDLTPLPDVAPELTPEVKPEVKPDDIQLDDIQLDEVTLVDVEPDDIQPDELIFPDVEPEYVPDICTAECEEKVCGDDGCGGSCGECEAGYVCGEEGACQADCEVLCEEPECGPAGLDEECDCGSCDDDNLCTDDVCLEGTCHFVDNTAQCDDGNPCTGTDACVDGICQGPMLPAEELEGLNCLCEQTADCAALDDGNVCNGTLVCNLNSQPPTCQVDLATILKCNDDISCTADTCDPLAGCAYAVQHDLCDDGNDCTTNACIAEMGCLNAQKQDEAPCGAGFPNICLDGECVCIPQCDGKECGDDGCGGQCGQCDFGCVCADGTCIGSCGECIPECDGIECGPDGCGGSCGTCTGTTFCNTETWLCDDGQCQIPTTFPGDNLKVTWLKMGTSGEAGQAIDVDQQADTCAPANDCSEGRDNQFAGFLKSIAIALGGTEPLVDSVEDGKLTLLYEMQDLQTDGSQFTLNIYRGKALAPKDQCNFQTEVCDYEVLLESFNEETCLPVTTFDNSQLVGDTLVGGGPGYYFAFPFVLGLAEGKAITFMASNTRIVATVQFDEAGKPVQIDGIIGCAIPEADILTIADAIPEDKLPLPKAVIVALLQSVVNPDIDSDGDGVDDAVSAAMLFTARPGNIVGLAQ